MPDERDEESPLLPTFQHDSHLDRSLRESLRILRDQADETEMRGRIEDVLAGRASLRDLARSESFAEFVTPLAERGWERWDAMGLEEQERLVEQARADLDPWQRPT